MADVSSLGVAPSRPIDTNIVKGLYNEKLGMDAEWAKSTAFAPIVTRPGHEGEYPVDKSWRGVDLERQPNVATAVALDATDYDGVSLQLGSRSFECERFQLGQIALSDREVAKLSLDNGIDLEQHVSSLITSRAAALHYHQVMTLLGDTNSYQTGMKGDPGNITSSSFDLVGLINTVTGALLDAQTWTPGTTIHVIAGYDVHPNLQKLDQVKARSGNPNANFATADDIAGFFAEYMPGAVYHRAMGRYKAANGTKTAYMSNDIAFVIASGGSQMSFLKTIVPEDTGVGNARGGQLDIRTERTERLPGQYIYADAYYDVHISEQFGGYLAHTLGS